MWGKAFILSVAALASFVFAATPSTSNYQLSDYGVGTGGGVGSTDNYQLEGITGEQGGPNTSTDTYSIGSGLQSTQQANVPAAPSLSNETGSASKLRITIDTGNNPGDTVFAIAISDDDFVTTRYVQSDMTVSASLGIEDYQTYAALGGAGGIEIIGLEAATLYTVKVKAMQGKFTESGYSPSASAETIDLTLTFDMDVASSDTESSPPYSLSFGDLLASTITEAPDNIWFDIESNAENGTRIFIVADNTGLKSEEASYTITSASGDLSSLPEGIGAQSFSVTQTSGTLAAENPYNGGSENVGIVDAQYRTVYSSSGPLEGGRASLKLKAKAGAVTPAASDYAEIYTAIAAASF